MDNYYSIPRDNILTSEIVIQKSRFLGFAKYVDNVDGAIEFVDTIRNKYKDATHVVYAYIVDGIQKSTDDREPSGTAGRPILEYLQHQNANHIVMVVVRYFGGVKLGTGGLSRAYQGSANQTIQSSFIQYTLLNKYILTLSYSDYQNLARMLRNLSYRVIDTQFDENVRVTLLCDGELDDEKARLVERCFDTIGGKYANNAADKTKE